MHIVSVIHFHVYKQVLRYCGVIFIGEKLDKNSYAKLNEMLKKGSDLEKCFNAFSENVSLDFSNKTSLLELYLHDFVNLKFEKLGQHEVKVQYVCETTLCNSHLYNSY